MWQVFVENIYNIGKILIKKTGNNYLIRIKNPIKHEFISQLRIEEVIF